MIETPTTFCYVHPTREATLRCKKCDRYICSSCAQRTPTGYMCKECVRERQKVFDTAEWYDYVIVFFVASILSGIGAAFSTFLSFWMIFLAPVVGSLIANAARWLIKNRRSRSLNITLIVSMILGALPVMLLSGLPALVMLLNGGGGFAAFSYFLPIVWQIIYLVIAVPSAFSQFSGLVFRK